MSSRAYHTSPQWVCPPFPSWPCPSMCYMTWNCVGLNCCSAGYFRWCLAPSPQVCPGCWEKEFYKGLSNRLLSKDGHIMSQSRGSPAVRWSEPLHPRAHSPALLCTYRSAVAWQLLLPISGSHPPQRKYGSPETTMLWASGLHQDVPRNEKSHGEEAGNGKEVHLPAPAR